MKLKNWNEAVLLSSAKQNLKNETEIYKPQLNQNTFKQLNPQELYAKISTILNSVNNAEIEHDFRRNCALFENQSSAYNLSQSQAYQEFIKSYRKITCLYLIQRGDDINTDMIIFDTETETEKTIVLDSPSQLTTNVCLTQLPNGELFCLGNHYLAPSSTLIIGRDFKTRTLPSGVFRYYSSAIFFNGNVYCFGGYDNEKILTFSSRFCLDKNRWNILSPMLIADAWCHSIIYNENILISGYRSTNILIYSTEIDSFSIIPYDFREFKRKILINSERLYLIEDRDIDSNGFIYESEIGDIYVWKRVGESLVRSEYDQIYCLYNKESIYIGCLESGNPEKFYFKFNLKEKVMIELKEVGGDAV